ncbi:PTS sugar transporter subunit IIA [Alkalibacter rhizosphaerae]|uniref:PTS sugar transporter subunit IIA n=2 Tax=Alkalibacter rhizosphaerae TaxID=2815577 RepID=A0A975AJ03_9FIRM|nr:PTS sugar transporter subunit IIA [Alkalibacter rhizosphaerae]
MLVIDQTVKNNKDVIQLLCGKAKAKGFITDEFVEKILAREDEFPTGLPSAVPVAIPHIHDGCLKSFFSMAVLREPIAFESMDGSDDPIMTEIVFLFGITDPSQQCAVLMKFCELFQDGDWMNGCKNATTKDSLIEHLKIGLGEYLVIS